MTVPAGAHRFGLVPTGMFVILVGIAIATSNVVARTVDNQNARIVGALAAEVGVELTNEFDGATRPLMHDTTTSIGVARPVGDDFEVIAMAGPGPVVGSTLAARTESALSRPGSRFSDLDIVLYSSPTADPAKVVISTAATPQLSRGTDERTLKIGNDVWLLRTHSRVPPVGDLAARLPWLVLGAGIVIAFLTSVPLRNRTPAVRRRPARRRTAIV